MQFKDPQKLFLTLNPTALRIHSNDLSNVATAAAAATTHLNHLTVNNTHNNITNTNIQVNLGRGCDFICENFSQAATAAASAAVSLATQSGIAVASASGLVQGSLVGSHNAGYNNNKIRSDLQVVVGFLKFSF